MTGRSLRGAARQWRYPPALRIARAAPSSSTGAGELAEAVRRLAATPAHNGNEGNEGSEGSEGSEPGRPAGPVLDDRTLANLATGLWRARRRMLAPGSDEPRPEVRKEFRHVQSTWDTLADAGVRIQDHDGDRFVSGLALEVLVFQPTAGLEHEEVVETIRPSVYVGGRSIQLGQVIVGTPDEEGGEP